MELGAEVVRAAGGIVLRPGESGGQEVLLVHRPAYDDWTFPKGKADHGESDGDCALREVEEETGIRCALGEALPPVSYYDNRGRPKIVRYFRMRPLSGEFSPHGEIDDARWLPLAEAAARLSYRRDRELLARVAEQAPPG